MCWFSGVLFGIESEITPFDVVLELCSVKRSVCWCAFFGDVKFRHVIYNCLEIPRSSYSVHMRCLEEGGGGERMKVYVQFMLVAI